MSTIDVIEFFAGSGLVTEGLGQNFSVVWAGDLSEKKEQIYCQNHGYKHFHRVDIATQTGKDLPEAELVWASFPCQDLSLAGKIGGIDAARSGMFWEWLRVLDEMPTPPKVVCLENVVGLLSSGGGQDYQRLHLALEKRGYRVGPLLLDAMEWLPQSRRRVFIVGVLNSVDCYHLQSFVSDWPHPTAVKNVAIGLKNLIWWQLPRPQKRPKRLSEILEWDAEVFDKERTHQLLNLIPNRHQMRMEQISKAAERAVFPGYRRTRSGKQVLELRFDDCSGCLRTAEGGSSRQFLILWSDGKWSARLLTQREVAALMGAPLNYKLPLNYNDSYSAMGDAVAVPVVRHIAQHLLRPLVEALPYPNGPLQEAEHFCLRA